MLSGAPSVPSSLELASGGERKLEKRKRPKVSFRSKESFSGMTTAMAFSL